MITFLINLILGLANFALLLAMLMVVAYLVITLVRVPANKWTELLRSIVEPALELTRKLMDRYLPKLRNTETDWSPIVLLAVLALVRLVIDLL